MTENQNYLERMMNMKQENSRVRTVLAISSLALASMSMCAYSQAATQSGSTQSASKPATAHASREDAKDAKQQMRKAVAVVNHMKRDPQMKAQLQKAQGVFIVPDYGRAGLAVGGRGGEGVLMVKQDNGTWGDPAFFTLGGISAGLEAGAEAGEIAMVLTNEKAVDSFKQSNNWSLNAESGLTIVNWSPKAQGSVGKGDVIVWANTKGLFGNAGFSVTDINFDENETGALYGKQVALQDILNGTAKPPARQVAALKQALPKGSASTSTGSSSGNTSQGTSSGSSSGSSSSAGAMGSGSSGSSNSSGSMGTSGSSGYSGPSSSSGSSGTSGSSGATGSSGSSSSPSSSTGMSSTPSNK
jgi:lipid-binding SYLF domain-containing protein